MAEEKKQLPASLSSEESSAHKNDGSGSITSYFRVFRYADALSCSLFGVSFVAAAASGVALPLMDLVFGKFVTIFNDFAIGTVSPATFRSAVSKYALYIVYIFIAKFLLTYIFTVCISIAALRTTKALRADFLRCTLRQNIAYFDSAEVGSTALQVTTNGNEVNKGMAEKLAIFVQACSTFIAGFAVAFAVQWKLTLITASVVPTIIIVTAITVVIDIGYEGRMLTIYGKAGSLAEEVFASMRTVHAFWLQPKLLRQYDSMLADAERVGMKKSKNLAVMYSVEFFCTYAGYALAFWQGIRRYASGEIAQSGSIFTVIFAVVLAAIALTSISPQITQLSKASSAAGELFKVIDREPPIDALDEGGKIPTLNEGRIEVEDVHFSYPSRPDVPVLLGLSLKIPAGKTTALVGASGSGKSTIVGLLERWYEQGSGTLYLDGADIRDINIRWLRTNVRVVQQEPVLFSGTVFENVANGLMGTVMANLPQAEQRGLVKEACRLAFADDFVQQLPAKYDTHVGERAMMLSGGQKQRIAIARAIVSNPRILLLDEATSALDPKAEKVVQQALDNVAADRTTLVIAHKLATVRNADNIAVMSQGAVIEQGTHESLLAAEGAYARLVRAQDLGQAGSGFDEADVEGGEKGTKRTALTRPDTEPSPAEANESATADGAAKPRFGLLKCLLILVGEQNSNWKWYAVMVVACVLGGGVYPAQAIIMSRAFYIFQQPRSEMADQGDFYALMFFVLALGIFAIYGTLGFVTNIIGQTTSRRYRLELFNNTVYQNMSFFDEKSNGTGAVVSRLSTYPTNLQELLSINIGLLLINIVNVLASSILGIAYGWKLGLVVVFGGLPLMLGCGWLRIRLEFRLDDQTSERFADSASIAAEAVSAIRTVASLTLEREILRVYEEKLSEVAASSINSFGWTMLWYSLTQSISLGVMALGFWYGGSLIADGEYTPVQFFVVFIAVIFSGEAAAAFFQYTTSLTKAQTAANYVLWCREQHPPISEDPSKGPEEKGGDGPIHVESEALEFCYPTRPEAKVLDSIEFDVKAGQFAALVGPSGCGKSTMIALLERFYDSTSGSLRCDDVSLRDRCPRRHRRNVALVQQEPILYQGSLRDNIANGLEEDASDEQVVAACRQANIYDFITSLPYGLNTLVGSRGTQLSGGQRQRIAIARALVRGPRLLLLDEATSALDTESEKVVQQALEQAKEGRTTIAVAHRLSTIKDADAIMVFSKGRIAERGTHAQLLAKRGIYYEMCLGQALDQSAN